MGKFNTRAVEARPNTVNRAGGAAYEIKDAKKEIASVVLSSMLKGDKYYQSDASAQKQIFDLAKKDPEFSAKAMIYTRQVGNLRSVSHLLANSVAENASGNAFVRSAIRKAIVRPDDMTEMAALWFSRHSGKMLPNSMRRAFKDVLESGKWDAFQLKRYAKERSSVKLRDVILLTHPKDTRGLFKGVLEGTLEAPKSLETKLASGEKASDAFEDMLREGRLGYMAAVKNIRNALETGISTEALDMWVEMITDRKRVLKSRMLPFRFVDAWEAVKGLQIDTFIKRRVKDAFNQALIHSAWNLDFVYKDEKIALILDESGSMSWNDEFKKGLIMASVLYHALPKENVVVYFFDSKCREVEFGSQKPLDILDNHRPMGGATYFHAPLNKMIQTGTKVDKIVMFTDMQLYAHSLYRSHSHEVFEKYLREYRHKINRDVSLLFWDLRGYGEATPVELKNNILLASGFSDKLLAVIPKLWRNENALVDEIEAITL
jgi:hypothetical protein